MIFLTEISWLFRAVHGTSNVCYQGCVAKKNCLNVFMLRLLFPLKKQKMHSTLCPQRVLF